MSNPPTGVRDVVFEHGVTPDSDRVEVWLDGVRRPSCVKAHALQGWALSYQVDDRGRVVTDGKGEPRTVMEKGFVELKRQ